MSVGVLGGGVQTVGNKLYRWYTGIPNTLTLRVLLGKDVGQILNPGGDFAVTSSVGFVGPRILGEYHLSDGIARE